MSSVIGNLTSLGPFLRLAALALLVAIPPLDAAPQAPVATTATPADDAAPADDAPPAETGSANRQLRPAQSPAELAGWLNSMVRYHHYSRTEIAQVTGLSPAELDQQMAELQQQYPQPPQATQFRQLMVLPYPGGRHPRRGFLEGAIDPARETKISIFLPWDPSSYVVADVPEAIWSNLGLTFLAHTHIPTIYDTQGVRLANQEWDVTGAGTWGRQTLHSRRELPHGIVFETHVRPAPDHVTFSMSLTNGTPETLSDLRVQNCLMLARARGFDEQTNDNKRFADAYAVCQHAQHDQWIIWGWSPIHRTWGNLSCPCLHADPQFPDCPPGQTRTIHGWLSFYEGTDIDGELRRIDATGWKEGNDAPLIEPPVDAQQALADAATVPLRRAHAHNDYEHTRPLADALDQGFGSVEADVFLVDGQLLVAHNRDDVRTDRTLERLYLDPLRQRIAEHQGRVWPTVREFMLWIDIKSDGTTTFLELHKHLLPYQELLTRTVDGHITPGPIRVVISGNRDWETIAATQPRLVGVDGRLSDLGSTRAADLMPAISDNWTLHFRWRGEGEFPPEERERLQQIVGQAHEQGRWIRFWATPESPALWEELVRSGADLINTDQLAELKSFLLERDP